MVSEKWIQISWTKIYLARKAETAVGSEHWNKKKFSFGILNKLGLIAELYDYVS